MDASLEDLCGRIAHRGALTFRQTEGKGYGVFATHALHPGTVVLEEGPLCQWQEGRFNPYEVLATQVLTSPERLRVMGLMSPYEAPGPESLPWGDGDFDRLCLHDGKEEEATMINNYHHQYVSPQELARLRLVLESNAFPMGLYSAAAKVNHSCVPNCRAFQDSQDRLYLEVISEVAENGELVINYLDRPVLPWTHERQRALEESYGFSCACELCTAAASPLEALACPRCGGAVVMTGEPTSSSSSSSPSTGVPATCSVCGVAVDEKWVRNTSSKVEALHHKALAMGPPDSARALDRLLHLLDQASRHCHPRHLLLASLHHAILWPLLSQQQQPAWYRKALSAHSAVIAVTVEHVLSELWLTMKVYKPPGHPDIQALEQLQARLLSPLAAKHDAVVVVEKTAALLLQEGVGEEEAGLLVAAFGA